MVRPDTRLVLTDTIYFKAKWQKEFDKAETRPGDFHRLDGTTVQKPLMYQTDHFAYGEVDNLQVLEMPCVGDDFALVILLPRSPAQLAEVEGALRKNLGQWLAGVSKREVVVTVPTLEMTKEMSMKYVLSRMGMASAFTAGADFRGMDDGRDQLILGDVIHKAFVEVSEKGTEAAAATAVMMAPGCPAPLFTPERPPYFTADRPFVYLIPRQANRRDPVFLGRYLGINDLQGRTRRSPERVRPSRTVSVRLVQDGWLDQRGKGGEYSALPC